MNLILLYIDAYSYLSPLNLFYYQKLYWRCIKIRRTNEYFLNMRSMNENHQYVLMIELIIDILLEVLKLKTAKHKNTKKD